MTNQNLLILTEKEFIELSELHQNVWNKGEVDNFILEIIKNRLFKYTQLGYDCEDFWRYVERVN